MTPEHPIIEKLQQPKQYTDDEIKEACKYALSESTLENRDQFYLGFRSAFIALGALKA